MWFFFADLFRAFLEVLIPGCRRERRLQVQVSLMGQPSQRSVNASLSEQLKRFAEHMFSPVLAVMFQDITEA